MTYHNMDPNRPTTDPYVRQPMADRSGMGWGIPVALLAVAVVLGVFFLMPTSDRTTTASNEAPASRQVNPSTPTPAQAPVATPPAKQ
jgi:hypothetical protein